MTTIGHKIRKLRELKNLKQEHMAEILGLSLTAYGNIERDETNISHERLEQIAKVFGIAVIDLLAFDEKDVFNHMNNSGGNNSHRNETAYDNIKRGKTNVSNERLEQIAKVFGMSVADLPVFDEKTIFNNYNNSGGNNGLNNIETANYYQFPEEMKKLYEDKTQLQDQKIEALQKEIEQLKKRG